jgi:hypothetical protein
LHFASADEALQTMHQQLFGPPRSSKRRAKSAQQAASTLRKWS